MDPVRYERLVEEAISIKRRSRRDQVRLMTLIKEVNDDDLLEKFCGDINLSVAAAKNYLAAYDNAMGLGIVPGSVGADEMVQEMWDQIFDPTLHDTRYDGVDREGIDEQVEEMGLKGPTKAYDIAKNVMSLMAAIRGSGKAAKAAAEALAYKMEHDEEFREVAHAMGIYFVDPGKDHPHNPHPRAKKDPWFSDIVHAVAVVAKLKEKAFADDNAPPALMEYCTQIATDAQAVVDLIRGRIEMDHMENV